MGLRVGTSRKRGNLGSILDEARSQKTIETKMPTRIPEQHRMGSQSRIPCLLPTILIATAIIHLIFPIYNQKQKPK
jgi:hypothetical protein